MTQEGHTESRAERGAENLAALGSFALWGERVEDAPAPDDDPASPVAETDADDEACPNADPEPGTHV